MFFMKGTSSVTPLIWRESWEALPGRKSQRSEAKKEGKSLDQGREKEEGEREEEEELFAFSRDWKEDAFFLKE